MKRFLSPHFTLGEMTRSMVALRRDIANVPDEDVRRSLEHLAVHILEPVRLHFDIPFSPSSVYRSIDLNRAVGSKDSSQHILGEAADFELPGISNHQLAVWIRGHLEYDQLILEFYSEKNPYSGWVHCSFCAGDNRGQSLTYDGSAYKEFLT